MNFLNLVISIIACTIDVGLLCKWTNALSDKRTYNRILRGAVICTAIIIGSFIDKIQSPVPHMLLGLMGFIVLTVLLFKDSIKRILLYSTINYIIGISVEVLFGFIVYMLDLTPALHLIGAKYQGIMGMFLMLVEKSVKLAIYYSIVKSLYSKIKCERQSRLPNWQQNKADIKYYVLFYIVSLITYIILTCICVVGNMSESESGLFPAGIILLSAVGIIIINVIEIYFFEEMSVTMAKANKAEAENMRLKLQESYYNDLEELHSRYDIVMHDMKHILRSIAALAEDGNCEEISAIIQKLRANIGNMDAVILCRHKILNALLNERKVYAANNGLELDIDISEPIYLQDIDELDLIALMGNLIDNAIEAEIYSQMSDMILCKMHMSGDGNHIIINIENSYAEKRRNIYKDMLNGKEALAGSNNRIGRKHGIGLKSVNEIVNKYGGIMKNAGNEGRYSVKIILPVQNKQNEEASYADAIPAYANSIFK